MRYISTILTSSIIAIAATQASIANPIQVQNDTTHNVNQSSVSIEKAMEIAKQRVNGQVVAIEYDAHRNNQYSEYEVKLVDDTMSYELDINASTGAISEFKQESLDNDDIAEYNMLNNIKVNLLQAVQFASNHLDGQVIEAEYDVQNGQPMYALEVIVDGEKHDVNINADTAQATITAD